MSKFGKTILWTAIVLAVLIAVYALVHSQSITVTRHWTAPYDPHPNRPASRVASYQLRYSTDSVNFFKDTVSASTLVPYAGTPADSGRPDSMIVSGLPGDTRVWFAIRAVDSAGNVDGWSNIYAETEPDHTPPTKINTLH